MHERGPSGKVVQEKEPTEETPSTTGTLVNHKHAIRVTLAHTDGGAVTASLDLGEEDDEKPFHEFNWHRMQQCGVGEPSEPL